MSQIETGQNPRGHIAITGNTPAEIGRARGLAIREGIEAAYRGYAEIFRAVGVTEEAERSGALASLAAIEEWRPQIAEELRAVSEASGMPLERLMALNARTEILALGSGPSHECSTVAIRFGGEMHSVQTWDWHIDLAGFWHTQNVAGPGYRFAGVTEKGILAKIGLNEAGLAVNFNILGHEQDGPGGVPVHVLAYEVLRSCSTVAEAVALVRATSVSASTSLTLTDVHGSCSLEVTPVGVFEVPLRADYLIRTNHFQDETPLGGQKENYEPDSIARLELVDERIKANRPVDLVELVALLESGEAEPPLSCVPDLSSPLGDRWATLATVAMTPSAAHIQVLDGMPTQAANGEWRVLRV
ncbi:C45 family autoproteolytic acyltransferase/hydrolase (plasmid) [Coraliomargarita sp. W4R53]